MFYTGLMMICACASYGIIIINSPQLKIPFGDIEGRVTFLFPTFGWAWWLTLMTGIVTIGLAILIWVLNYFMPRKIAIVFHHSVVEEDEFFQVNCEFIFKFNGVCSNKLGPTNVDFFTSVFQHCNVNFFACLFWTYKCILTLQLSFLLLFCTIG